jgi:capsule polysaccharide export protein KpsE/RkpR
MKLSLYIFHANFEEYGIIIEEKDANKIEEILKSYTDLQIIDKQLKIKEIYKKYYTYEGAFNNIKKNLNENSSNS